jgi:hypothetical protein
MTLDADECDTFAFADLHKTEGDSNGTVAWHCEIAELGGPLGTSAKR